MDNTQRVLTIFDTHAQVYQDKYMDVSLYADTLDLFCEHIVPEHASVLDIACGPGNIARYLLDRRPDVRLLGIDLAPNMIELARSNNPGADFQVMDCREINRLDARFDAVICGFGLPYLSKEEALALIRDVANLLPEGGAFCFSTMEDDYSRSGWKGPSSGGGLELYQYFHQADYLTEGLQVNGFQLLDLRRKAYAGPDGAAVTDLLMLAVKQRL